MGSFKFVSFLKIYENIKKILSKYFAPFIYFENEANFSEN